MHPDLMAELANDRRSELLRMAASRRRGAFSGARRTPLTDRAGSLTRVLGWLRHPAAPARPTASELCCA